MRDRAQRLFNQFCKTTILLFLLPFTFSANGWLLPTQRPVAVVVGELDLKKIRHVDGIGGDNHVVRAKYWVKEMNKYAQKFGKRGSVEFILVPNVGHNYGKLARVCQAFLKPYI